METLRVDEYISLVREVAFGLRLLSEVVPEEINDDVIKAIIELLKSLKDTSVKLDEKIDYILANFIFEKIYIKLYGFRKCELGSSVSRQEDTCWKMDMSIPLDHISLGKTEKLSSMVSATEC